MKVRQDTPGKLFFKASNNPRSLEDLYIHLVHNLRHRFYLKKFVENVRDQSDVDLKYREGYQEKQFMLAQIAEFVEMLLEITQPDAVLKLTIHQFYLARKYNLVNSKELTELFQIVSKKHTAIIKQIASRVSNIDIDALVYCDQEELSFIKEYLENVQALIKRTQGDEALEEFNRENQKLILRF